MAGTHIAINILKGVTWLLVALMIAMLWATLFVDRKVEIKDCTESEVVLRVSSCVPSRRKLVCTVETTERVFKTNITAWPSSYLREGDEIFWCTRDVQWGATHSVNCKDGKCF